jgi:hypothetical protein
MRDLSQQTSESERPVKGSASGRLSIAQSLRSRRMNMMGLLWKSRLVFIKRLYQRQPTYQPLLPCLRSVVYCVCLT